MSRSSLGGKLMYPDKSNMMNKITQGMNIRIVDCGGVEDFSSSSEFDGDNSYNKNKQDLNESGLILNKTIPMKEEGMTIPKPDLSKPKPVKVLKKPNSLLS